MLYNIAPSKKGGLKFGDRDFGGQKIGAAGRTRNFFVGPSGAELSLSL
jgi:hypothetical protein